jgi:UDP-N-acetylglucosamine 2-epimerase (non-hydrolysing)/GDP/UDP-N,N'-diacetylbacillosamine 2-epimerase (hydrolysing)
LLTRAKLEEKLACDLGVPAVLVSYHPVTLADDTLEEAEALFLALSQLPEQLLFCYPNADAGSRALIERTKNFLVARGNGRVFVNLDALTYWSLLREVGVLVGNSSSGIMETASFGLPTVNVGIRQHGRERPGNVVDAAADAAEIVAAIRAARRSEFRESLRGMSNPYGDGTASEKIAEVLTSVPLGKKLLRKRAVPLAEEAILD